MRRAVLTIAGLGFTLIALLVLAGLPPWTPRGQASTSDRVPSEISRFVNVFIELADDPAVVVWEQSRARAGLSAATLAAQAQGASILAAQVGIESEIAAAGGYVLYSVQRTVNGVAAWVPDDQVGRLSRLPGVKSVQPLAIHRQQNAQGASLIGAPQLWAGLTGLPVKGEEIKIGIIDSGVDYLHTDFGGSGLASDFARNDTTVITDQVGFPSVKVAGGFDFIGDEYDGGQSGDPAKAVPRPDPDPMECKDLTKPSRGHGTHVAGSAAGYGVNADGTTYAGPWDATSVPTTTMKVGPGVAPLAKIYSLRALSCAGIGGVTPRAIDWSVDPNGDFDFSDRLDVINLSLGSNYGGGVDPSTVAANRAAQLGVIVVAAAGNEYDAFFIVNSPGAADRAISVAATNAGDTLLPDLLRINSPPEIARQYTAVPAQFGTPITGTLVVTADLALVDPPTACSALTNPISVTGKIAVIDQAPRGALFDCPYDDKVKYAQDAGAVAALVVNAVEDDDPSPMRPSAGATVTIPALMVSNRDGSLIKSTLILSAVNGTIDASARDTGASLRDTLGSFSSRGPGRAGFSLKPDVAAPGVEIFSAYVGTGSEGTSKSGTSMATPHVAGSMALLRQIHRDWSVEELKALIMNTAGVEVHTALGLPFSPSRQGAGRAVLPAAATAQAVAFDSERPGVVSLSYGSLQVESLTVLTRSVRVVNKGTAPLTYQVAATDVVTAGGVTVTPVSTTVTVDAGSSVTIPVRLTVDPAGLSRQRGAATLGTQYGTPRHFLTEHGGHVTLTGPDTLKVPYYVDVRPASLMRSDKGSLGFSAPAAAFSTTLTLAGTAVTAPGYDPRVWALELQAVVAENAFTTTVGTQKAGEVRLVGVGTDVPPGGSLSDGTVFFGLATSGPMATGSGDAQFFISIDTDRNGIVDFTLSNATLGPTVLNPNLDPDDVFIAALRRISGTATPLVSFLPINYFNAEVSTAPYSSTVIVLPVSARELRLQGPQSRFSYTVEAIQPDLPERQTSKIGPLSFDPAAPALRATGGTRGVPVFSDRPGTAIRVEANPASIDLDQPKGLLLLHHLNRAGNQAEVIALRDPQTFLPFVGRATP